MMEIIVRILTIILLQIICLSILFMLGGVGVIALFLVIFDIDESYAMIVAILFQYLCWIFFWSKTFHWKTYIAKFVDIVGSLFIISCTWIDITKIVPPVLIHMDLFLKYPYWDRSATLILYVNLLGVVLYYISMLSKTCFTNDNTK